MKFGGGMQLIGLTIIVSLLGRSAGLKCYVCYPCGDVNKEVQDCEEDKEEGFKGCATGLEPDDTIQKGCHKGIGWSPGCNNADQDFRKGCFCTSDLCNNQTREDMEIARSRSQEKSKGLTPSLGKIATATYLGITLAVAMKW